jgi:Uma2 family endonuclease
VFIGETGYLLSHEPPTVLIPDVGFVSFERGRAHVHSSSPFPGAPDLAVEVLSPSNRPGEIHGKVADYLAAGCRLVWVVDPKRQAVAAHRDLLSPALLGRSDHLEGGDVLPGFRVLVEELFEV